jgi:hypothetical protein
MNIQSIFLYNIINKMKDAVTSSSTKIDSLANSLSSIEDTPAFYTVSAYSNTTPVYTVYSHNLRVLHRKVREGEIVTSSQSEVANNNYSKFASNSYPSSGANYGSSCANVTVLGHQFLEIPQDFSNMTYKKVNEHDIAKHIGSRIGSRKFANHIPLLFDGNKLALTRRTHHEALFARDNLLVDVPSLSASVGKGGMSFNSNTNRVAFVKTSGATTTFSIVYCDMTKDISEFDSIQDFVTEFEANKFTTSNTYSTASSSGGASNYEYPNITLCDNGDIYVSHAIASVGLSTIKIPFVSNAYGVGSETIVASTTSVYSLAGSDGLGLQKNISNDGRYAYSFCSYYYYGSGLLMHIIDTVTSRVATIRITSTSYGYQPIPINKNNLFVNYSVNSDGNVAHSVHKTDFETIFASSALDNFLYTLPAFKTLEFDNGYYSTDYPYMVQITNQDFQIFAQ